MEHRPFCCSVKGFVKKLRLAALEARHPSGEEGDKAPSLPAYLDGLRSDPRPGPQATRRGSCACANSEASKALTAASMTLFILTQAPEPYIVITGFEVTITLFFIILYMLRLDQIITFLFWPLLDILNSLVAAIFILIISVLALIPETTKYMVLGGVCGLLAVVCCIADAALIYRKLLFNPSGPYQKKAIHDEI